MRRYTLLFISLLINLSIFAQFDCDPVSNILAVCDSNNVTITFTGDFASDHFEYVVSATPLASPGIHSPEALAADTTSDMTFSLTGVLLDIPYYVYVRATCASDTSGYTPWTMITFTSHSIPEMICPYDTTGIALDGIGNRIWLPRTDSLRSRCIDFDLLSDTYSYSTSRVEIGITSDPYDDRYYRSLATFDGGNKEVFGPSIPQHCTYSFAGCDVDTAFIVITAIEPPTHTSFGSSNRISNLHVATCEVDTTTPVIPTLVLPYEDSFEDYGYHMIPEGWTVHSEWLGQPPYCAQYSSGHTGTWRLTFGGESQDSYQPVAVLPLSETPVNRLEVSLFVNGQSSNLPNDILSIGVMTDAQDTATYTEVYRMQPVGGMWEHAYCRMDAYTGDGQFLAIKRVHTGMRNSTGMYTYYGFSIDDLYIGLLENSEADTIETGCPAILPEAILSQPYSIEVAPRLCWTEYSLPLGGYAFISPELAIEDIRHYGVCFDMTPNAEHLSIEAARMGVGIISDPSDWSTYEEFGQWNVPYAAATTRATHCDADFSTYEGDYNGLMGKRIAFFCSSNDSTYLRNIRSLRMAPYSSIMADSVTHAVDTTVTIMPDGSLALDLSEGPIVSYPYAEGFDSPNGWVCGKGMLSNLLAGKPISSTVDLWSWKTTDNSHNMLNISGAAYRVDIHDRMSCWLFSPRIDLSQTQDADNLNVSFVLSLADYFSGEETTQGAQFDDRIAVAISRDGGQTWRNEDVTEWSNRQNALHIFDRIPRDGARYAIDLTPYRGDTIRLGFYAESSQMNGDNMLFLDDLFLSNLPIASDTITIPSDTTIVTPPDTIPADTTIVTPPDTIPEDTIVSNLQDMSLESLRRQPLYDLQGRKIAEDAERAIREGILPKGIYVTRKGIIYL